MDDGEWLRAIDPTADTDAPEQIERELGGRYELYLREAKRIVIEGAVPDEAGLGDGIRSETRRYLGTRPHFGHPSLEPTVAGIEETALAALGAIVVGAAAHAARKPAPPIRRLALQPAATIVGNMTVRKTATPEGMELSWDAVPNAVEWTVRVSVRPDPRQEYSEGDVTTIPAGTTSCTVRLDDLPRRIQIYGHARDGRIVRRAVISAVTSGNSGAQWKRQATAS